ncbi:MAG: hypothetical protein QM778_06460 [Myxococcales bacterium]
MASLRKLVRWTALGGLLSLLALGALYGTIFAPYYLASWQYGRLLTQAPRSRAEVENILALCSHTRLGNAESYWYLRLPHTVEFERYSMWGHPIDVGYDQRDRVVRIVPAFQ